MPAANAIENRLQDVALVLALTPVVVAPQLLGGVHPESHLALCLVALTALVALALDRARRGKPLRLTWLALPFAVGLVASLLALLPAPHGLRQLLDADGADRVAAARALLSPAAGALVRPVLAWDPPETALSVLRLASALACTVVVAHVARHRAARRLAYRALLVGGALLFVVALGHALGNVPQVWGRFGGDAATFHAPLVNTNHLGKAFAFFALLGVGRALSIRRGVEGFLFLALGLACAAATWLTDSRGAALALVVGALCLLVLLVAQRTRDVAPWGRTLVAWLFVGGVLTALLAFTVGVDALLELAPLDPKGAGKSKLQVLPYAWRLAETHGIVGIGPGAFGVALPGQLEVGELNASRFTWTHVENLVAQSFVDHGLVIGAALAAVALAAAWVVGRSGAAAHAPAATAALAGLLVGETVDFFTELPAGLLLAAVALGLVAARASGRLSPTSLPGRTTLAATAALVVAALLSAPMALADWRHRIDGALAATTGAERLAGLERALARHPSDAHYAYGLATAARARRDPRGALQAANRALNLWPAHRGAHVEAARALAALGHRQQALLEYRVAWRCGAPDPALLAEVLGRFPTWRERRAAFPDEPGALDHLCSALRIAKSLDDAQRCLDDVASLPGADARQRGRHISFALERGDVEGAASRADAAMRETAPPGAVAAEAAIAFAAVFGAERALERTAGWPKHIDDPQPLVAWRVRTALTLGKNEIVDAALVDLKERCRTADDVARWERVRAEVLEHRGQLAEAEQVVARLAARSPEDVDLGLWQARLQVRLGLAGRAAETASRLRRAWPADARVARVLTELGL